MTRVPCRTSKSSGQNFSEFHRFESGKPSRFIPFPAGARITPSSGEALSRPLRQVQEKEVEREVLSKFSTDTPVCHPLYGLGRVQTIEVKEVLGESISLAQIFFPRENLQMMVNIDKETELFRPLIEETQVDAVFEHMRNHEGRVLSRANQRQRANLDKIKSNDIFQLSEVIKELAVMSSKKKLSFKESEMLDRARRVMIEELALVTGGKAETMDELIARACLPSN